VSRVAAGEVRAFILDRLQDQLEAKGLSLSSVPDDFDLLTEGVIDSMGIVELIVALEQQLGTCLDFEELDPENLTIIGPLCRYIEEKSGAPESDKELLRRV
jgi:acyl carrier protein